MSNFRQRLKDNKVCYKALYPIVNVGRRVKGIYLRDIAFYIGAILRKLHLKRCDAVLKALENKCCYAKRIFVVATGPSLTLDDLEWLQQNEELTISCNGIFKMYDRTIWRPTYYALDDYYLYRSYQKDGYQIRFEEFAQEKALLSLPVKREINYFYDRKKVGFVPICYHDHWFTHDSKRCHYCHDLKWGHYDLYTVTNFAINIADYMGIKEIYLLGVDCSYAGKKMHCGEEEQTSVDVVDALALQRANIRGYHVIKDALDRRGVKVYNATRGGELEVFPRVSMDDIIQKKAEQ